MKNSTMLIAFSIICATVLVSSFILGSAMTDADALCLDWCREQKKKMQEQKQQDPEKEQRAKGFATNFIGIQLTETCVKMQKNNITNSCPSYEYLAKKFDNTTARYSGGFSFDKDGLYRREKPPLDQHWKTYIKPDLVILVDPNDDYLKRTLKLIIIGSDQETRWIKQPHRISENKTRVEQSGVYFDGCTIAHMPWSEKLFNKTIFYMQNQCNGESPTEEHVIHTGYNTTSTYTDSRNYQYRKCMEEKLAFVKEGFMEKANSKDCINIMPKNEEIDARMSDKDPSYYFNGWTMNVYDWWSQYKISNKEFSFFLKYLNQKEIINDPVTINDFVR